MKLKQHFAYNPEEHEAETASNGYVLSLVGIIAGMPLPIINVIGTVIFYLSNKNGTFFVRWHCTQVLLSQLSFLVINSLGFWWTVSIIFTDNTVDVKYIVYIVTLIIFNLIELVATIYTAIEIRKGIHVEWWLYGKITNFICKPK